MYCSGNILDQIFSFIPIYFRFLLRNYFRFTLTTINLLCKFVFIVQYSPNLFAYLLTLSCVVLPVTLTFRRNLILMVWRFDFCLSIAVTDLQANGPPLIAADLNFSSSNPHLTLILNRYLCFNYYFF